MAKRKKLKNKHKILKLLSRPQFSRVHLIIFAILFGALGAYTTWQLLAAPNFTPLAVLEAENMTLPAGIAASSDDAASGGQVVVLNGDSSLSGKADLKLPAKRLEVVAKGDECGKSPKMSIKAGEQEILLEAKVKRAKLKTYSSDILLSPGTYNITIGFASQAPGCNRTLTIDKVSFLQAPGGKQPKPAKSGQKRSDKNSARISCAASDPEAEADNEIQKIDIAQVPDGEEMTEYKEQGGYRLTHCDRQGKIKLVQDVEELADQQGKKLLVPRTITQPEGNVYATETITYGPIIKFSAGDEQGFKTKVRKPSPNVNRSIKPPKSKRKPSATLPKFLNPVGTASAATPECLDLYDFRYVNGVQARWPGRAYTWFININSYSGNPAYALHSYYGHWVWAYTFSDCFGNITNSTTPRFNFYYGGYTPIYAEVPTYNGASTVAGVTNVENSCGRYAAACTKSWWNGNYNLLETDIVTARNASRRSDGYTLYWQDIAGCPNTGYRVCLDYLGALTHETGHTLWFDHSSRSLQTMWYRSECTGGGGCGFYQRTLGVGDILGLYYLYPW